MKYAKQYAALVMLAVAMLLAGCGGPQMTAPQTVKESMVVVAEQTAAAVDTANKLYQQGSITEEQHKSVLGEAQQVQEQLDTAKALLQAGDEATARQKVGVARQSLVGVRDRLKELEDE